MATKLFPWKTFVWVTVFAIAMGFLENSVVVYMRALLYPRGFTFPLVPIPPSLALTEVLREASTLIMLIGIGVLAGKSKISRFAWFLYAFAIWDIFYYVFLKLLLNWPESWMTWDILFLIPTTWVGPVITPVIVSFTMILCALLIVHFESKHLKTTMNKTEWLMLVIGSIVLIISFIWDYSGFILEHYSFRELWSVTSEKLLTLSLQFIPREFNWFLFILGELIILFSIWRYWKRHRRLKST